MSAQVDVLEVMDRDAAHADAYRIVYGVFDSTPQHLASESQKARAAVAALIAERDALRAKVEQQPAPVDLEQFRAAICSWRQDAIKRYAETDDYAGRTIMIERKAEADRLLSIINAGKVECAEPVAWITPESIRHLAKMSGPANVVVWNCASGNARVPLYAAPRQPAPVVDDAMVEWKPRNRTEAAALAKIALAHLGVVDAYIDNAIARMETDAARAQGVQS